MSHLYKIFSLLFLFVCCWYAGNSQCTALNVTAPSTYCKNGFFQPTTSTSASNYEWDFCTGDLAISPTPSSRITSSVGVPFDMSVAQDGAVWYSFVVGRNSNTVNRVTLGDRPATDIPQDFSMGNPGNFLSNPTSIKIKRYNNSWFGLVYNEGNRSIVLLQFGGALANIPSASVIATSVGGTEGAIDFVQTSANSYVVIVSDNTGNAATLFYNNGLSNGLTATNNTTVGGYLVDVEIVNNCSSWSVFFLRNDNRSLARLDFGSDFSSSSLFTYSTNLFPFSPYRFWIGKEGDYLSGLVTNINGGVANFDIGIDVTNISPFVTDFGNLGGNLTSSWSIFAIKASNQWVGFTFNGGTSQLFSLTFPNANCGSNIESSSLQNPGLITYTSSGVKFPLLTVTYPDGTMEGKTFRMQIQSADASPLQINFDNYCLGSSVNFTAQSPSLISNANWIFGDGATSVQSSPSHSYTTIGQFTITLTASFANACQNISQKPIQIFNAPIPNFSLPTASPFCTNQSYTFTNTSAFDTGSNPTWQWNVNALAAATTQNLNYTFLSNNSQQVTLTASIPGCSSQVAKTINSLQIGPLVNFNSPTSGCQGSPITFSNTTTGSVASLSWNFDDGNTSANASPSNIYSNIGVYQATLQVTNSVGCVNSQLKSITIYSKPQPNFSIGLPPFSCANTASQFSDGTPSLTDSNIASWQWNFGDAANGSANQKNPTYTYSSAGSYNVSLTVGTNFGCTNVIQKAVTISSSPVAGYSNLPACVNQATQFTDASSGSIKSRLWQIGANTFTTPNPQFTFLSPGSFPVVLTVTGNNNCTSQTSKNINVPVAPTLDFSTAVPCTNGPTTFTELTTSSDPSVSQSWAFGNLASGSGSPSQYSFAAPGNYSVRLSSARQSGCVYSITKSISIVNSPVADFSTSIDAGASPLPVSFVNNSTFANSYLWKFGASSTTSNLISPTYVFTDLGNYTVELTASNTLGCFSKTSKVVSVVVPLIDVLMTDFYFLKNNSSNSLQPVVTILNNSNVSLVDPVILVDVAGGSSIKKSITGTLRPNQEVTQMLDFQLVPRTNQYVCAEVEVDGDTDIFLNRKCLSLSDTEILFAPFPNPAKAELNMDWISQFGDPVKFQIVNSSGAVFFEQTTSSLTPGINRIVINTSLLATGIYLIRFSDNKVSKAFSFSVVQ